MRRLLASTMLAVVVAGFARVVGANESAVFWLVAIAVFLAIGSARKQESDT